VYKLSWLALICPPMSTVIVLFTRKYAVAPGLLVVVCVIVPPLLTDADPLIAIMLLSVSVPPFRTSRSWTADPPLTVSDDATCSNPVAVSVSGTVNDPLV
jgi:hypothetical protein